MIKYLLSTLFIFTHLGYSQGYCALRHPQSKINKLYPECQNFETLISTIDDQTRLDVEQHLGFPLYFYEIGRHNLYAIKKEDDLLGIIHARSEKSKWGLVEIIWSLDLNLNVDDFAFQRCRTSSKNRLLEDDFKKIIRGKNFTEIKAILKNLVNNELYQNLNENQKTLTKILLKSAIKTIALTEYSWADEIKKLRLKHLSKKDEIEYQFISSVNESDSNELKFFKDTNDKHYFYIINKETQNYYIGEHKEGKFNILYQPILSPKSKDSMSFTSIKSLGSTLDKIPAVSEE
jgi:hypothetical protein